MTHDGITKTVCRMCHGGCGALVEVLDGRVTAISGDRDNPNNQGFLCAKGRASIEHLYHPDRLRYPLRRVGPRGSGRFARISWDEAYETVSTALAHSRQQWGAESVVFAQGTDRNYQEWLFRFANAFGSPNVLGPAHVCFYPRVMASILSMGAFTFCDYEGTPEYVILWGSNKAVTHGDGVIGTRLFAALRRGTRLIVVDPRRTPMVSKADHWLRLRPGTDAALALGMIHVIIDEGLFDAEFVRWHTCGFDQLAEHVRSYSPSAVAELTSVPASLIRKAARTYATAAAAGIELGTGAQQNRNSFQTARAVTILSAICGNIDRPGGDVVWEPTGILGRRSLPMTEALPSDQHLKRLGSDRHRILTMAGWAHPGSVWRAVLEHKPYPVRTMFVLGSNLLVNYADSQRVHQALNALDFLAVNELFLTPTSKMADVVLPVSGWLERDQIVEHANYVAARRKLVQVGECKSDEEILNELARRLGSDGFWSSVDEALDARLAPIGWRWKDLTERYYLANQLEYFKYRTAGFATRSGKFNIFCPALSNMGYDPLPTHYPLVSRERADNAYLLTSAHSPFSFNSEFRNVASLRGKEPDPVIEINPGSAAREGITDGDWVEISRHGKSVLLRAKITDTVTPEVVCVSATWWYPEMASEESWQASNINLLTTNEDENEEMGSSNFRGIYCHLRRASVASWPVARSRVPLPSTGAVVMKKIDFKAERPQLYKPRPRQLTEVEVPPMKYLMIDGKGDPNTSREYKEAVEALYAVSYALKFKLKKSAEGLDYTVMPLEGLWWLEGSEEFSLDRRGDMHWTAMIAQPDAVTSELFEEVRAEVTKKKDLPALPRMRLEEYHEGRAAQILHVGPYEEEPASIEQLHRLIEERGANRKGKHHEIYLSDPTKTAPEKMKIIIRQPF